MRIGFGLNVEQTQKLIMTPELRQAIAILQLSSLELETYIQQQLQENPLLEISEGEEKDELLAGREETAATREEDAAGEKTGDLDWQEYFQDSSDLGYVKIEKNHNEEEYSYENYVSREPTMQEHLHWQLNMTPCDAQLRCIISFLIGNLDGRGYLRISPDEAASILGTSPGRVEEALAVLQTFDPPGIGARDLAECLLIQLRQRGQDQGLAGRIVRHHLDDLARGKLMRIAGQLDVPVQEVQLAVDLIRSLEPKPGRNFASSGDVRYVVPDVVLEKVGGDYIILINDTALPRLTINQTYRSVLQSGRDYDDKTRRYVESKLNAAAWLLRSIEQRRMTLYKVASCLVELQRDFLDYGVKYLKPLNLKKVAEMVGLHESTVSRATSNKYIQTPRGVFEMKYFFSTGLGNTMGTGVSTSAESIKKMLKELVAAEDPRRPYNDQAIAEIFHNRGIKISRRTVAKYRDELGIPPIRMRRRY